ncbi:GDSL family lipase [bacterium BFN5]|nr:GDSL family lipase [bacterium BFN5]
MLKKILRLLICLLIYLVSCQPVLGIVQAANLSEAHKVRLVWNAIPDAVMYELLVTTRTHGKWGKHRFKPVITKSNIYTAGTELDLTTFSENPDTLWWQVRALNLTKQPISEYSSPRKLSVGDVDPTAPLPSIYADINIPTKLYQVYSWIPVLHAGSYEVQVFSRVSQGSAWGDQLIRSFTIEGANSFDWYDESPYPDQGAYWWQVRANDTTGRLLGDWSKAVPFTVKYTGYQVAALGDSVTHGGGAVSNTPSDPAYDWTTYAGFPIKNLGRSGDTTAGMAARFDREVVPFAPKILVIMGGVNDLRGGAAAEDVIDNLVFIQSKCQEQGIIPVFATVTPVNPTAIKQVFNQDTYGDWQTQWQKVNSWIRTQPYYVDVAPMFMSADGTMPDELATDGLHPDTKGKAMIGTTVGNYLKRNFPAYTK